MGKDNIKKEITKLFAEFLKELEGTVDRVHSFAHYHLLNRILNIIENDRDNIEIIN